MKDLIEYIAKELVEYPDQIAIRRRDTYYSAIFNLQVAPSDMGKIIGKQGRVANAMRTLLKVAAVNEGKRVILEIERLNERGENLPDDQPQPQQNTHAAQPQGQNQPRSGQQSQHRPFRRGPVQRGPRNPRWNQPR